MARNAYRRLCSGGIDVEPEPQRTRLAQHKILDKTALRNNLKALAKTVSGDTMRSHKYLKPIESLVKRPHEYEILLRRCWSFSVLVHEYYHEEE